MDSLKIIWAGVFNSDIHKKNISISEERTTSLFELEIPIEDGGISYLDEEGTKIEVGTVMFFKPGQKRHTRFPLKTYYLHFTLSEGRLYETLCRIPAYIKKRSAEKYLDLFKKLMKYTNSSLVADEVMTKSICLEIVSTLCYDHEKMLSRKKIKPYNYKAIESAIGYIKNNLSDNLSLQAVSEHVKYSPYHFHKCFKKYTSTTLREFVEEKRIEKAISLLTTTQKNLTQISYECGFSSQAYFSYSFKKKTGLTPREYANEIFLKYEQH